LSSRLPKISAKRPRGRPPKSRLSAANASLPMDLPVVVRLPEPSTAPIVVRHLAPAKVSEVYESYWRFAAERQAVFFRRARGETRPWTDNPVLAIYKFTNAYRASDRVSQYLIRHVIYRDDLAKSPSEVFFRILLFKLFNKIETWELLERALGPITFEDYRFAAYDAVLTRAMQAGHRIYSAAYIMPPGSRAFGRSAKHQNNLLLLERMMADRLAERLVQTRTMQEGFEKLRAYPTIGDFLAYQFITDINYSELTDFSEMDFVVPGPGARDGLRKCFVDPGGLNEPELIRLMADLQEQEFERLGLDFQSLWGRRLQLIDCQNLFCEVDKYARVAHPQIVGKTGRVRIKQKFEPTPEPIDLFYPPKWKLNDKIRVAGPQRAVAGVTPKEISMDFNSYQKEALRTDRVPARDGADDAASLIVPMLGLAGETGQLLSEFKKHLRDREAHRLFKDRVSEELGDLLWYIANVASKFDLSLSDIAAANLAKVNQRWATERAEPLSFDATLPEGERLPRRFEVELVDVEGEARQRVRVLIDGKPFGAELTDNAYDPDGYRFHDVFHFALRPCWAGRRIPAPCSDANARADHSSTRSRTAGARPLSKRAWRRWRSTMPAAIASSKGSLPSTFSSCARSRT
jgi:NTP pyrophosphatase (non-canonical NTP hydrolase)